MNLICSPRLVASLVAGAVFATVSVQATAQTAHFDIPAQPLAEALRRFASQSGAQLVFPPALGAGKTSRPVTGTFDARVALQQLLQDSGLEPRLDGATWTVVPIGSGAATLAEVRVIARAEREAASQAQRIQREGRAADGYRTESISSVGALGGMRVLDTPYAITAISGDLLRNLQAQSPDDVYKISPSTLSQTPQASGWAPMVKIRGFTSYDRAEDGLRRSYGYATSLEDKERVEVLNGLSGFLFGAASPGGMVNYVSKRPTLERFSSVTVGNYGGSQAYVHGDFGGNFDKDGRVGYRLNVVRQKGETAVDDQDIDRTLASLALDVRVTDRLKLELGAAYSDYKMRAPTAYWTFREGVRRIQAPDSSKNWGQPWVQEQTESRKLSAKAIYEANDRLTLRMAYMRDHQDRPLQDHTMNSVRSPTEYYQIRIHSGPTRTESEAWQALADVSFNTGIVSHKLTLGHYGFEDRQWQTSYAPNTGYLGPNGFFAPNPVAQPIWPSMPANSQYFASRVRNKNWMIGDLMAFNDQWSLLVGANRSTIQTLGLDAAGRESQPEYDRARTSPNLSLIFKPTSFLTTYATYIEGLEQGGVAPLTAANSLSVMPPMLSKQKELGMKVRLGGILLSSALFDIQKAYEFTDSSNVYSQDGQQRHRGAEISAQGKLTPNWSVVGGLTWLTAKVEGGANSGKSPMNVPKVMAKLYSEYELSAVPGLSLTGGVYHVGRQWATATNTARLPSFTTIDVGLRYATRVSGKPVSFRLNANNVADRDYWLNSYYLGSPRSVAFSAEMSF